MATFSILLFFFSVVSLIIGIINPKMVLLFGEKTRKKAFTSYLLLSIISLIVVGASNTPSSPQPNVADEHTNSVVIAAENKYTKNEPPVKEGIWRVVDGKEQQVFEKGKMINIHRNWAIGVTDVRFAEKIGNEFFGEEAGQGFVYALVKVQVDNKTKQTLSLPLTTIWNLYDNNEYKYDTVTLANMYLNTSLKGSQFGPEETRQGEIVFRIKSNPKELTLKVSIGFESEYIQVK